MNAVIGGLVVLIAIAIGFPIATGFITPVVTNANNTANYPTAITVFKYLPTIFGLIGLFGMLYLIMFKSRD